MGSPNRPRLASPRARALVAGVTLLALGLISVFVATRFRLNTDMESLVPRLHESAEAEVIRAMADGAFSRLWVVAVETTNERDAVAVSSALEAHLKQTLAGVDSIARVTLSTPDSMYQSVWSLYAPRRFSFWPVVATDANLLTSDEGLRTAAKAARVKLSDPSSTMWSRVLPDDPWLITPTLFESLRPARAGGVTAVEERLITRTPSSAIALIEMEQGGTSVEAAKSVLAAIDQAYLALLQDVSVGPLARDLHVASASRYAIDTEAVIRADLQRVTVLSVMGLALVVLLLFRGVRVVLVTLVPVAAGLLAGAAAVLAVFGRVHGLTLAFGGSLLGVAIDYVVHVYCHFALGDDDSAHATVRRIGPSLWVGALTTFVGFAVLGLSKFDGLREIALFSSTGIAVALWTTYAVVPLIIGPKPKSLAVSVRLVESMHEVLGVLRARRSMQVTLLGGAVVAAIVGVATTRSNVDLRALNYASPALLADEAWVKRAVALDERSDFVVALGDTAEEALQVNDRVYAVLRQLEREGVITALRGLGPLLPSAMSQQQRDTELRSAPALGVRAVEAFTQAGFAPTAIEPFVRALDDVPPTPLKLDDLLQSPLRSAVEPYVLQIGDRVGIVTFVSGVTDAGVLGQALSSVEGSMLIRQSTWMNEAYLAYEAGTRTLLAFGIVAVFGVLLFRYRNLRHAAAAFMPAVLAAGCTLAALSALGVAVNLVVLTSLLMVVSVGVDYAVFLVDQSRESEGLGATLLSLIVAWLTTVLGFGMLIISKHPVLFSVGATATVGVTVSLVLAPTSLFLLEKRK